MTKQDKMIIEREKRERAQTRIWPNDVLYTYIYYIQLRQMKEIRTWTTGSTALYNTSKLVSYFMSEKAASNIQQ